MRTEQDSAAPAQRAKYLEDHGAQCVGQGLYQLRLALLYLDAGDLSGADRAVQRGLLVGGAYSANLRHVQVETTLRRGDRQAARTMAAKVAEQYPTYTPILGVLADFAMADGRWDSYLELYERAHQIEPNKALPLLGMAVALHQLDRHDECIARVRDALRLEPARIARTTGIKEAIFSLGVLKRNSEAAELLRQHMAANPRWAQDPGMVSAARALHLAQ